MLLKKKTQLKYRKILVHASSLFGTLRHQILVHASGKKSGGYLNSFVLTTTTRKLEMVTPISINLWFYRWPENSVLGCEFPQFSFPLNAKVSDIIFENSWRISTDLPPPVADILSKANSIRLNPLPRML